MGYTHSEGQWGTSIAPMARGSGVREATGKDPAKTASDARELLRLKKKEEEGELGARAIAASPASRKAMAQAAPESLIGDAFGALATGDEDTEDPDMPAEVARYI